MANGVNAAAKTEEGDTAIRFLRRFYKHPYRRKILEMLEKQGITDESDEEEDEN